MQIIDLVPDLQPVILAARQARDARNTLAQFLPNKAVPTVKYRMGRTKRLDQTVPVRALDAPATPIRRPGVLTVQGNLPAITPIVNLSEQDLTDELIMAQQLAGLPVDFGPSVEAGAVQGALTVDNTLEVMRGQLLSTGVVSLVTDDGTVFSVDFGLPTTQKVTPAVKWTDGSGNPTGDPFGNLVDWHNLFINTSGQPAGVMLTTSKTLLHLANRLQAAYPQQPVGASALAGYISDRNLPPVYRYDRTLMDADGNLSRVLPEGVVIFLPAVDAPIGDTELGITQEAVQQVQRRILTQQQAPGLTIVTLGEDNPIQRAVKAAAVGLPILRDIQSIVIASGLFS